MSNISSINWKPIYYNAVASVRCQTVALGSKYFSYIPYVDLYGNGVVNHFHPSG